MNETHEKRLALAGYLRTILDATVQGMVQLGWSLDREDSAGIEATKKLVAALEDLDADKKNLIFLLGHFESTMMGYVDSVTVLEEKKLIPEGFSEKTIRTVRSLREQISASLRSIRVDE